MSSSFSSSVFFILCSNAGDSTVAGGSESRVPPLCSSEFSYSSLQDSPSSDRKAVAPLDSSISSLDFIKLWS
ncbi:hypothetical protein QQF64_023047 [Cirrhinus molitorella]|uniref:Secreted protein n=1 Tax=Cirrhinus molitorella TaxID=172907 RepID=A0ABR3L439_9TELE